MMNMRIAASLGLLWAAWMSTPALAWGGSGSTTLPLLTGAMILTVSLAAYVMARPRGEPVPVRRRRVNRARLRARRAGK